MDPMIKRMKAEAQKARDWLETAGIGNNGAMGEFGVPDNVLGDGTLWQRALDEYYAQLDAWQWDATYWAAAQWQSFTNKILPWRRQSGAWTLFPQADIIKAHPQPSGGSPAYRRGINIDGAYWGYSSTAATSTRSNVNVGVYNTDYHYDDIQAPVDAYAFHASQGVKTVRLCVRWERMQRTLGGALDATEMGRVDSAISVAAANGISVVLDVHNWGVYYLHNSSTGLGERKRIGAASEVTNAQFADLMTKLGNRYKNNANVIGIDMMNEPVQLVDAATWQVSAQAGMDALRTEGFNKMVWVPTYNWSHPELIWDEHPGGPWITDAQNNHRYTFHQYFGRNLDSSISEHYNNELAYWEGKGYGLGSRPFHASRRGFVRGNVRPSYRSPRGLHLNLLAGEGDITYIANTTHSVTTTNRLRCVAGGAASSTGFTINNPKALNFHVRVLMRLVRGQEMSFSFRRQDGQNNWYVVVKADEDISLYKVVANVFTRTDNLTTHPGTADTKLFDIICRGSTIEVWLQGKLLWTRVDSANMGASNTGFHTQVFDATAGRGVGEWEFITLERDP